MVRHLLDPTRYRIEVSGTGMLTAEVVARVDLDRPALLCIGAVAPGGLSQARHLCKRLRSQYPELKIVVGRWGLHDEQDTDRQHLLAAGADYVETTVLDTQRRLTQVGLTLRRHHRHGSPRRPSRRSSVLTTRDRIVKEKLSLCTMSVQRPVKTWARRHSMAAAMRGRRCLI
jgi:hypothetical protein